MCRAGGSLCSLAAADDSGLLRGHGADDLEYLPLHFLGFGLGLLGLLAQLLGLLSCQHFSLILTFGLEEQLLLTLVGLAERVDKPDGQVVVCLLLLPLELLSLLLSLSLCNHAWVEHIDRHFVKLADFFLLSGDSPLLGIDPRLNFLFENLLGFSDEFRKLDLDGGSDNELVVILSVVNIAVLVPLTLREEAFWHIIDACVDLLDSELLHLLKLFCSADTASKRERAALLMV